MPFTVAHVALVLPLRSARWRLDALPTAPLVIGSMVPDLPGVLGVMFLRPLTHALPGVFTLDVLLAALVAVVWTGGLRATLAEAFPLLGARWAAPAASRTPRPGPSLREGARRLLAWYAAAAVGSLTHVLWDGLTHPEAGADLGLPVLDSHPALSLGLQLASSVVGLAVLALWVRRWWRHTAARVPPLDRQRSTSSRRTTTVVIVVAVLAPLLLALQRMLVVVVLRRGFWVDAVLVGEATFGALCGALVGAVLLAGRHRRVQRKRAGEAASKSSPAQGVTRVR